VVSSCLNVEAVLLRPHLRAPFLWLALSVVAGILSPAARSADKQKNEKVEPWIEIRTSHFIVASDGGEKTARRVADQFENMCRVFQATLPHARLETGFPIRILAARDGKSFANLFPEFPAEKRSIQPAGSFVPGTESNYIALRMNASGHAPYQDIYREYARLILKFSYQSLPPWLEEGYANVFGSLTFDDKGAWLGRPDPEDLSVLWESPLLPLDLVFHVDRNSAYYDSGSKTTVYFAESRALVHYLLSDPQMSAMKSMDRYITLVESGVDALQAARQTFGDLQQMQTKLESYIKQIAPKPSKIQGAGASATTSSSRTLSTAETEALLGDFALSRGKFDSAETKLQNAIRVNPSLASAEQSFGYLLLEQNQLDEAEKHFTRALELDPNSALAYYGQGKLLMMRDGAGGAPSGAIAAFEKSVSLNANFAPAWYNLASLYALRLETLQKALDAAQRAASLVPGEPGYQYQVAVILASLGRREEARKVAAQLQDSSEDRRLADKAGDLLAQFSRPPTSAPPASPSGSLSTTSMDRTVHIERKTEPNDTAVVTLSKTTREQIHPPAVLPAPAQTSVYSMVGTISEVNCADSPQIQFTLKAQTIVMHLHAADVAQIAIKSSEGKSLAKNATCIGLRGRSARVSYRLVPDKSWDGEIQSIELRKEP
jgi:tetratricopeptide (TPR) repeat protein